MILYIGQGDSMRSLQLNKLIFSGECKDATTEVNTRRTSILRTILKDTGCKFTECQVVNKGTEEASFIVVPKNEYEASFVLTLLLSKFARESVLRINPDSSCYRLYDINKEVYAGTFNSVPNGCRPGEYTVIKDGKSWSCQ